MPSYENAPGQKMKAASGVGSVADPFVPEFSGVVGGNVARPAGNATFTRPSNTTAYASGDLVANSETAGSVVVPTVTVGRDGNGTGHLRKLQLKKSGTTATNASFRVHLFQGTPTVTNGDNGAFLPTHASWIGAFDVTMIGFGDCCAGVGVPLTGSEVAYTQQTLRWLVEARGAYTPASAEVFTLEAVEDLQN
jgi:hypothetical protein